MIPAFPTDDYTPYGYLDNPYDAGPWVGLEAGGVIRSIEACGFAWFRPGGDNPSLPLRSSEHGSGQAPAHAGLRVGLESGRTRLLSAEDFHAADVPLVSRYHTSRVQTFDFTYQGVEVSLAFMLAERDALLCRATLRGLQAPLKLVAEGSVRRQPRRNARAAYLASADALALLAEPGPWYAVRVSQHSTEQRILDDGCVVFGAEHVIGEAYSPEEGMLAGELGSMLEPGPDGEAEVWIAFGRGTTAEAAVRNADAALRARREVLAARLAEDERFWKRAPRPVGDWPEAWRRGWVYDLETTRLMVRPPVGVFKEVWPTWQLFRPRVVLAENTLDMLRLAYADPETAQAALLTVFREAPQANVPCMFANGSFNMVAAGGDACGTSPAWCLPFHNIYLLYLWHPDRAWLRALYPHLEAYLRWWMEHRRDEEGWFVYRCTWEAGEDGTPRLDPARTGHGDIFHQVRPAELQAAMAHSALIMTRLGQELGLKEAQWGEWAALYQEYVERTRSLWDTTAERFRDAYPPDVPPITSRESYWDGPADLSALHLIPLMYDVATPEQAAVLASHLLEFNKPPWTCWASWTYTIVEAARAVGAFEVAGRIAHDVLASVYPRLDRREDADVGARPGTSHEWWPGDLSRTTVLNETYGWGATTATLLLRHLFGLGPSRGTGRVAFELAPSLQGELLRPGRRLGFANLHYRGVTFDLALEVGSGSMLTAQLTPGSPATVLVEGDEGSVEVRAVGASAIFQIRNGHRYFVTIA